MTIAKRIDCASKFKRGLLRSLSHNSISGTRRIDARAEPSVRQRDRDVPTPTRPSLRTGLIRIKAARAWSAFDPATPTLLRPRCCHALGSVAHPQTNPGIVMPAVRRLISLVFAIALVLFGIADVVYLLFYASQVQWWMVASAALSLALGGTWVYSDVTEARGSSARS
jgi:hypothetical protein